MDTNSFKFNTFRLKESEDSLLFDPISRKCFISSHEANIVLLEFIHRSIL